MQEAAPENYAVKQSIVAALDEHGPADAIFASSTSGLLITEIAKFSKYPERCIGAHPYNPPHLIPWSNSTGVSVPATDFCRGLKIL